MEFEKNEWVLTDRRKDGCHYAELPWQPFDEECVDKPYILYKVVIFPYYTFCFLQLNPSNSVCVSVCERELVP